MKKKTRLLFFLFAVCIKLHAQNDSIIASRLAEAKKYLYGIGVTIDAPKAFTLYSQLAQEGNGTAMNILGKLYQKGKGIAVNENQAVYWFTKAATAGITEGWYNIGVIYKEKGDNIAFEQAFKYFDTAANFGDEQSVYAVAYMHYKGLGCQQDYTKAANLFKKGAIAGRPNSMYFYGLCLRNGYGLMANQDSASYWLQKAAKKGYKMAVNELASNEAENNNNPQAKALSQALKADFLARNNTLNQFQKVDAKISTKIADGEYEGYLVRFDWSGQHAISSSKLKLKLNYKDGKLFGQWIENDSIFIPISAGFNSSSLVFDDIKYTRQDHYNPQKGKLFYFKNANLQWSQKDDSVYLIGNVQMFSVKQNEPDKPLFVSLKKQYKKNNNDIKLDLVSSLKDEVNVYPNPFVNTLTVDFTIKQKGNVKIQLLTMDGKIIYDKKSDVLDAGSYTFPLYPKNIKAGVYLLKVAYGNSFHTTKIVHL